MVRRSVAALVGCLAMLALGKPAMAGPYPDKPIRVIVPTAAGGAADMVGRLIAEKLEPLLHQAIVIENREGANGNIAAQYVATSSTDGYTLMLGTIGPLAINQSLYKNMGYDPQRDFAPVARLASFMNLLVVKSSLPANNVKELIDYAKARPGTLSFGSPGVGGSPYMSMILFNQMAGLDMVHVPFRGASPALTALLGGFIDISFSDPLATLPMLSTGRVRALAVSGAHRLKTAPDIPTVEEAGLPGYAVSSWLGIVAPTGLEPDRIALLNSAINKVLAMPEVQTRLSAQGAEAFPGTPEEFGTFMREEAARWSRVIEVGKLSVN